MDKESIITIEVKNQGTFSSQKGESVLSMLKRKQIPVTDNCSGKGICKRCVVRYEKGAPIPTLTERSSLSAEKLRKGYRLACLSKPVSDAVISIPYYEKKQTILSSSIFLPAGGEDLIESTKMHMVIDIGTTTVVCLLVNESMDGITEIASFMNPQRSYAKEVIGRVEQAMKGSAEAMQKAIRDAISQQILIWKDKGYIIESGTICANTVMSHILLGLNAEGLGKSPFQPVSLDTEDMEIENVAFRVMPGFSAFVGSDLLAGVLACKQDMQKKHISNGLLVDLGTNAEMILMTEDNLYSCSAAAGPAFEGGEEETLFGSELIKAVAALRKQGIVDADGYLNQAVNPVKESRVSQEDIRALQLAKAAVLSAIQLMLQKSGLKAEEIDAVYLAGGFGYFLDIDAACEIGLLPKQVMDKTISVGNSALAGGILFAKANFDTDNNILKMKQKMMTIDLANEEGFQELFVKAMELREYYEI